MFSNGGGQLCHLSLYAGALASAERYVVISETSLSHCHSFNQICCRPPLFQFLVGQTFGSSNEQPCQFFPKALQITSRVALSRDVFYASRLWALKLRLFRQFRQVQPHSFWHALLRRIRAHGFESGTNLLDPKKGTWSIMKQGFWAVF